MGIKNYQETNAKPMKKTRAQSGLPVKRKIQKTTQNVTFQKNSKFGWFWGFFSPLVGPIELKKNSLVLYFSPDRFWYPYIKFTTILNFDPMMGIFKFWGSGRRVKTVTKLKKKHVFPVLIYWNDNRISQSQFLSR